MSAISNQRLKVLIAAFIAPIVPGVLLVCLCTLFGKFGEGVWWLKTSALATYPSMLLLGVPAHLLLQKLRWSKMLSYLFAGAVIGVVVGIIIFSSVFLNNFSAMPDATKSLRPFLGICLLTGILGATSGSAFWLISRTDRT